MTPQSRSTKIRIPLDAQTTAAQAMRRLLARLTQILEENEPGTRADIDSEFLHDYRVTVRRTRSALSQVKGVLAPAVVERFRAEFAWLGAVTTPTRDLDVQLLDLPRYRAQLPVWARPDLEPLHDFLVERQRREHAALVAALDTPRYEKLLKGWRRLLRRPLPVTEATPEGGKPVAEVAGRRLRKMFRRALREGQALEATSPGEAFHELRKTCKKLRYLLEFFQAIYPPEEVRPFLEALKGLQDNLGQFQDLTVQTEALRQFSRELAQEGHTEPGTHLAIGMLVEKALVRQEAVRREFAERFGAFASSENRERFHAMIHAAQPAPS